MESLNAVCLWLHATLVLVACMTSIEMLEKAIAYLKKWA